jgi:hypothetical protein
MSAPSKPSTDRSSRSAKGFLLGGLVVALLLAGIVSFYASGSPDGLNRVAIDESFSHREESSAAADSPLADYSTKNVDNERLSGGLAGVVGVVTVLLVMGGVAYAVRRRGSGDRAS